jgi:hypothetical protein
VLQLELLEEDFRAAVASIVKVAPGAELDDALQQQELLREQQVGRPGGGRAGGCGRCCRRAHTPHPPPPPARAHALLLVAPLAGAGARRALAPACRQPPLPMRGRKQPPCAPPAAQLQQLQLVGQMGGMEASLSAKSHQRKKQRTEAMDRVRDWLAEEQGTGLQEQAQQPLPEQAGEGEVGVQLA